MDGGQRPTGQLTSQSVPSEYPTDVDKINSSLSYKGLPAIMWTILSLHTQCRWLESKINDFDRFAIVFVTFFCVYDNKLYLIVGEIKWYGTLVLSSRKLITGYYHFIEFLKWTILSGTCIRQWLLVDRSTWGTSENGLVFRMINWSVLLGIIESLTCENGVLKFVNLVFLVLK